LSRRRWHLPSFLPALAALLALLAMASARAGVAYRLDTTHAVPGETIRVSAVLFNDTGDTLSWTPRHKLVLQWRDDRGGAVRSLAYLDSPSGQVNVPVNNFVKMRWRAVVPRGLKGLQAVNVEGQPVLLALDTSPLEKSPVAGTPASVPVVDAGAGTAASAEPVLPASVVQAAGASPSAGPPAAGQGAASRTPPTPFENFRNALSPYEPIYFDVGTKGGAKARFQVSFKYRLFTPDDPQHPSFRNHFYLGYTQTSLWDLASNSTPFIDTTYNPSLFWQKDALWQSRSRKWFAGLSTGVEHKSNGKSGADSRSLNDGFIEPQLNYRFDGGSTLSFAPRIKAYFATNDNPDYADYAGHVDWKLRWAQDDGLVLGALYRKGHGSRQSTELDAAWPLQRTFLHMNGYLHLQYFNGYGETLLGYNQRSSSQVRIGLSLVP
jgi:outer membrane phospholipase A